MILAIETATSACSAAVLTADGTLVAQRLEDDRPAHTQRLLPFVHEVLGEAGVALDDLEAVVCGLGPGAYTGMRIGVATARALAQAGGLRLGGAPTLAAVALRLAEVSAPRTDVAGSLHGRAAPTGAGGEPGIPLVALLDGKRREVFAGVYRAVPGTPLGGAAHPALSELLPPTVVPADDLTAFLEASPGAVVGGDGAALYADRLPAAVRVEPGAATPSAAMVGRAWLAGVPGSAEGFGAVLPMYGRAPDAARWAGGRKAIP